MTDHAALRDAIAEARDAWHAAMDAAARTPEDDAAFTERLTDMRVKSAEHAALIRAGFLRDVGPIGED